MGDAADEGDAALAQQLGRSLAALAESREAVSQQKEAMEAMAARIAELEERDATTMDIKKLNDIAGERTRKTVGECVATHTRQRRDLDKLRFEVVQSGPEKGSLNVRSPLITDGHAVAQVYPRGLVHYLAAVIKDSDDEDGVCRGDSCACAGVHARAHTRMHACTCARNTLTEDGKNATPGTHAGEERAAEGVAGDESQRNQAVHAGSSLPNS